MVFDIALFVGIGVGCFVAGVVASPLLQGRPRRQQGSRIRVRGEDVTLPGYALDEIRTRVFTRQEQSIIDQVRDYLQAIPPQPVPDYLIQQAQNVWSEGAYRWLTSPSHGLAWAKTHIPHVLERWGISTD